MLKVSILALSFMIIDIRYQPNLPGANELMYKSLFVNLYQ